jgi:hypothetical protein
MDDFRNIKVNSSKIQFEFNSFQKIVNIFLSRLLSSVFNKEQASRILSVNEFQQFLLVRIFDPSLPGKLSNQAVSVGLSQTETIAFANIFDTISNLW